VVYDCYRASGVVVEHSVVRNKALVSSVGVTCTAQPFGRSDTPTIVDFQAPIVGKAAPPSAVTLDDFSTVPNNWLNGLQDAVFETGIGAWAAYQNCTVAQTAAQAHSGTGSLGVTSTGTATMMALDGTTRALPVYPGQQISVSAWFRAATAGRSCCAAIGWYTAAGVLISTSATPPVSDVTTGWTQSAITYTAPAGAALAVAGAQIRNPGAGSELHYVDDVSISYVGWARTLTGPGLYSAYWAALGAGIGTSPWYGGQLPQPLNANWDFEAGLANWAASGGATISQSSTYAFSGTKCLSFHGDGVTANPAAGSEQTIPVVADQV